MAKDMWTSISAFEDAFGKDCRGGCMRRWAFHKIFKLPETAGPATVFGDVFHAVLGRFYLADDRGLGVDGQPVNLYPEGWQSMKNRFGKDETIYRINPQEEALIRVLVDKAIADGILVRIPGRVVEREISTTIHTDTAGIHPRKIVLKGFIDLETPRSVEDHKTAKKAEKPYMVPVKDLALNAQLMTYAWDKYQRGHKGPLWIAHNNFIKNADNPQVIRREIKVSEEQVLMYFYDEIQPRFVRMYEAFKKFPEERDVERWREIQGPNDPEAECNYYFGRQCPYVGICTNTCSVGLYKAKYKEVVQAEPEEKKGNIFMSLIDKIKGNIAGIPKPAPVATVPAAVPAPAPAPAAPAPGALNNILATVNARMAAVKAVQPAQVAAPAPAPAPAPVQAAPAPEVPKQRAPWYTEFNGQPCAACNDQEVLGFNSKGEPCRICETRAAHAGKPTAVDYDITIDAEGVMHFDLIAKGVPAPAEVPAPAPAPSVTPVKKAVKAKTQTAVPAAPTQVQTPTAQQTSPAAPAPQEPTPTENGFTLLIGCVVAKGSNSELIADDLLKNALEYLASVAGKGVAEIEHFALMQALDAYIPQIAEYLSNNGVWVMSFAPGKGTALARLIDGLRPYAKKVIAPLV